MIPDNLKSGTKIVCIYKIEKDGKVRGTIINKESIQLLSRD